MGADPNFSSRSTLRNYRQDCLDLEKALMPIRFTPGSKNSFQLSLQAWLVSFSPFRHTYKKLLIFLLLGNKAKEDLNFRPVGDNF